MAQKKANQAAKKAASDGKITQKEAAKIQSVAIRNDGNAAIAIAKAAANNQAQIASQVQRQFGLDQSKNGVNYAPSSAPMAEMQNTLQGSSIRPGVAPITGYTTTQSNNSHSGSTISQAPVYTFFNKKQSGVTTKKATPGPYDGMMDKASGEGGPQVAQPAQKEEQKPVNNMVENWGNSVDRGLTAMEKILQEQMQANAEQTSLYMGMMQDMMTQMQNAQQSAPQGAYATTSYQVAPATGAVQTQEIARRKPAPNTDLSISAAPVLGSGVGTQLAI